MAADIDQPGEILKRTIAAAVTAVTAGTSIWLAATAGAAPAAGTAAARPGSPTPSATLHVVPRWTYRDGGKLAVIAGCSQRGDVRVIGSKLLPRPIRMSKGKNLLIKLRPRPRTPRRRRGTSPRGL
jgi:hypothetical protein